MDFIKKNIVSICLFLLTAIGGLVWSFIQKGAEVEFNEKVEQVLTSKIKSRDFMNDVMETDYMKEYKIIQQRRLSAKTGLTVEALVDSLAARVHEDIWTEKEIVELIRKYNRRMVRL
jgi:hypothetical protein